MVSFGRLQSPFCSPPYLYSVLSHYLNKTEPRTIPLIHAMFRFSSVPLHFSLECLSASLTYLPPSCPSGGQDLPSSVPSLCLSKHGTCTYSVSESVYLFFCPLDWRILGVGAVPCSCWILVPNIVSGPYWKISTYLLNKLFWHFWHLKRLFQCCYLFNPDFHINCLCKSLSLITWLSARITN